MNLTDDQVTAAAWDEIFAAAEYALQDAPPENDGSYSQEDFERVTTKVFELLWTVPVASD